ncbi:Lrp/AsnC family transcriptional regulator, partial [Acinetobacter baumannii]
MSLYTTGHPVVDKIASLNIEGNVIPANWFNTFKLEMESPIQMRSFCFQKLFIGIVRLLSVMKILGI